MIDVATGLPDVFLTGDIDGIGGVLKARPEDFLVEEIPAYEPCGDGEHLYLWIEKIDRPTLEVIRDVARRLGKPVRAIGYAGMKDKTAITRQTLSVHDPERSADLKAEDLDIRGVRVLSVVRHTNKLRMGHLRGNRFIIRVRDVDPTAATRAQRIMQILSRTGVPNFIGEQRFGYHQNNQEVGRLYVLQQWRAACDVLLGPVNDGGDHALEARRLYAQGEFKRAMDAWPTRRGSEVGVLTGLAKGLSPQQALFSIGTSAVMFFISSFQSAIFNRVLNDRITRGLCDQLVEGDIAMRSDGRGPFFIGPAELADADVAARLESHAITASGPMWGASMMRARGAVGQMEEEALAATGVTIEHFDTPPIDVNGARRPMRVSLQDWSVEGGGDEHGPYVEVRFTLARGAFATTVLREVMKVQQRDRPWGS